MKNRPLLSVIMPTYNGEDYIRQALNSIVIQGPAQVSQIEILVVDDGSTDGTLITINEFKHDLPIKIVASRHIGNWLTGTNEGIRASQGEFLAILHQDDKWAKDRLKILFSLMKKYPHIEVFTHNTSYIDSHGKRLCAWKCPFSQATKEISPDLFFKKLIVQDFLSIDAPVFKRSVINEIGFFDENFWYAGDWDFWLKLFKRKSSVFIKKELSCFRIHGEAQTIQGSKNNKGFHSQLCQIFERHASHLSKHIWFNVKTIEAGNFSNLVNAQLALALHQNSLKPLLRIIEHLLKLSPISLLIYLRCSRIHERVFARIKARRSLKTKKDCHIQDFQ